MRSWSKQLRMNRLFNQSTGKTVMVAMDHGQGGVKPGLAHPEKLIKKLIDAMPDAILLSGGLARRYNGLFGYKNSPALIISSDFVLGNTIPQSPGSLEILRQSISVEEAVKLGADAIKALLIFGNNSLKVQADNQQYITKLAEDCNKWNIPLIVEPTTWGSNLTNEDKNKVSLYADMARIASELGADIVKCEYVGTPEEYQTVVDNCPVPITILGGAKADSDRIVKSIEEAMRCGVSGVVFGRNVWQNPEPFLMVKGLQELVYFGNKEKFYQMNKRAN